MAQMTMTVGRGNQSAGLEPVRRGVLEVGGDERAFDVPLQPYDD